MNKYCQNSPDKTTALLSVRHLAFTIVELLIVVVVIGILAAITIVSYSGISSQANIASVQSDLDSNSRKLQLYYTQYGSYPTALDGSNCPSAPTVDNNYCLKLSSGNTVSSYSGSATTFTLIVAKGSSIIYRITPDTGPVSGYVAPTISSGYSGYDLLFCRYATDCSGVSGISSDFSYQVSFTAKAGSKYSIKIFQIDNTSTSWATGTEISANITYSTPTSGASFSGSTLTATNAGSTAATLTGTGLRDKTVFARITEVDGFNNAISDTASTKALGVYTTVGSYTLASPGSGNVNYLVVAGGGGGGTNAGCGGGAGGYRTNSISLSSGSYSLTVGGGGVAADATGTGSNSIFSSITSNGGGGGSGGGQESGSGGSGGSGGGGCAYNNGSTVIVPSGSGGSGTSGQGNRGGNASSSSANWRNAGGGGAGTAGVDIGASAVNSGTIGGDGLQNTITGRSVWYAGGGTAAFGSGASNGGCSTATPIENIGCGGTGGYPGGSGIVIFRLQ